MRQFFTVFKDKTVFKGKKAGLGLKQIQRREIEKE